MRLGCFQERLIGMSSRRLEIVMFTCGESTCANGSFFGDYRPKGAYEIKPGATRANRNKPGVCVDRFLLHQVGL